MYDCGFDAVNMYCMLMWVKCLVCACVNSGGSCISRPNDLPRLSEISSALPFMPARAVAQAMNSNFGWEHVSLRRGDLA